MGTSFSDNRYSINGLIKTDATVMTNLQKLCDAAGCWLTYDIYSGLWSVVINRAGSSEWSFDDNNIIGGINVSGTGLDALYNSVKVTYPREDIRGSTDFIQIEIPAGDRYPNEPDNTLQIQYDIVTDPIQAELLGFIELKQSRVDKIIQFTTDYSKISVKAGDIIDVTNAVLGFSARLFRVISVNEVESPDGGIDISITALEYDAQVYSEDLTKYERTNENGILAIGAIPAPDIPTITKFEQDSRPRVTVSTQITGGIVERMEFWYSTDTSEPNDDLRNYNLLSIKTPLNGSSFTTAETITAETDGLSQGDFYVKARAVNDSAVSPYSDTSALIEYVPEQTTQKIDDNTSMAGLGGALALTSLINLLAGSFQGNTSGGSLFDSVFGNYNNSTGFNLRTNANNLNSLSSNAAILNNQANSSIYRIQYSVSSDVASMSLTNGYPTIVGVTPFTPPISGVYNMDVLYHNSTLLDGVLVPAGDGGRGIGYGEAESSLIINIKILRSSDDAVMGSADTYFLGLYGHGGAISCEATLTAGVSYYGTIRMDYLSGAVSTAAQYTVRENIYYRGG